MAFFVTTESTGPVAVLVREEPLVEALDVACA
jgi:hypothetical protein